MLLLGLLFVLADDPCEAARAALAKNLALDELAGHVSKADAKRVLAEHHGELRSRNGRVVLDAENGWNRWNHLAWARTKCTSAIAQDSADPLESVAWSVARSANPREAGIDLRGMRDVLLPYLEHYARGAHIAEALKLYRDFVAAADTAKLVDDLSEIAFVVTTIDALPASADRDATREALVRYRANVLKRSTLIVRVEDAVNAIDYTHSENDEAFLAAALEEGTARATTLERRTIAYHSVVKLMEMRKGLDIVCSSIAPVRFSIVKALVTQAAFVSAGVFPTYGGELWIDGHALVVAPAEAWSVYAALGDCPQRELVAFQISQMPMRPGHVSSSDDLENFRALVDLYLRFFPDGPHASEVLQRYVDYAKPPQKRIAAYRAIVKKSGGSWDTTGEDAEYIGETADFLNSLPASPKRDEAIAAFRALVAAMKR